MSLFALPREIRLQIWTLVYFDEPSRFVALETRPHIEDHDEDLFCPRYCPSPAPVVVNICQESRAEACYQAKRAGHIIRLPFGIGTASHDEFYFRIHTDILYLHLEGPNVKHYDDSPEVGLLAHFGEAAGCTPTSLRNVAITKVILNGFRDGSLSNVLRDFPDISRMIMMVPEDVWVDEEAQKEMFVRAAARIVRMYKLDLMTRARNTGETFRPRPFDVDFARRNRGIEIIPKEVWRDWSDGGDEWATLDGHVDPFW